MRRCLLPIMNETLPVPIRYGSDVIFLRYWCWPPGGWGKEWGASTSRPVIYTRRKRGTRGDLGGRVDLGRYTSPIVFPPFG